MQQSSCRQRSALPAQELPPAAQRGGGQQEHTYIEYEYETRFGAEGMDVREKEQQGRQVEEEDGSRQDEVLHGRREEQRQRRSGDECASRFRDRSEKLASGGPVDVAERESGQQQARNRDGDFAQRAPEKHDGQRQQDQERRCGRGDERQQSDVERGAEDGVEAESVAVRTAEILRGEGQQGRCGEGRQAVAADGEAAGDRSVERDGETNGRRGQKPAEKDGTLIVGVIVDVGDNQHNDR